MKLKFTEVHYYEKGFSKYFQKELVPLLKKVEKHRTDSLKKFIVTAIGCAIVNILIFVYFFSNFEDDETGCTILVMTLFGSGIMLYLIISGFKDIAKTKVNELLVRFFGNFEYKNNYGIAKRNLDQVEFFLPEYDYVDYDDYIKGTYKDNLIEFCEAYLKEEYEDSDGDTQTKTVFKGLFIIITLPRHFSGKTFVIKDKGVLLNFFKKFSSEYQKLTIQNKEFEIRYEVYTTNPDESQALLNNTLQNSIMKLAKNFGCSGLNCCFHSNKVFFAIPIRKNLFESVSLFKPAYTEYQFKNFLRDFNLVLSLSDKMSEHFLNNNKYN
ncbi:MAG: DUF3137 domain-containing protein [Cyanobacteriota bacterium]